MKHNWLKTKFRASQTGALMTDPRSKSETISETTKTYLIEVYIQVMYGRRKDIVNKFIQKGLLAEEDSITLLSRVTQTLFKKNEEHLQNEWLTGTPDIITEIDGKKAIRDTKTSWDIYSFFKSKISPVDKGYYWQMQTYLDLTGSEIASLDYCLVNTPAPLIQSEINKLKWNSGIVNPDDEISPEAYKAIEKACLFDDIPLGERVHSIRIERNQEDINRLHERVELCRNWMQENLNN